MNGNNAGRLVYLIGPSGVGKDSLLRWLEPRLCAERVHIARRTITRPPQPGDEQHHAVDDLVFDRLCKDDAFALDWQANGLRYGIHRDELAPLTAGRCVIVNGSRAYLAQARITFPQLAVVHVSARPETLQARLTARARESAAAIESRTRRTLSLPPPEGAFEISNDGTLAAAGRRLLHILEGLGITAPADAA